MEHNWAILEEKIIPSYLGEENVIETIWFRLTTIDGEKSQKIDGRVNLSVDPLTNFIPYEQVSLEIKIEWIKAHCGDFYENLNIEKILNLI